ncbi:hypothetical protein BBI01_16970 [Chryseobacterium artocarpi]|uniref:Uncharacterized protein n=1 Tax=Chryseobacterium artocarpi TaxID=1414727 RepID=A0A1B8ZBA8_9FLAO|nr:hypothetical protein [Elizabethkingia anophelis]OCA68909.1 hypothetical protein BBI01_16970 [Chryseobacterium artocarpi]MDV3752470.1 hypothetical protein [Elizabethkingia anophelis]MDV3877152.1 hypothetical protein [Elizabethkingia anophelis]MDV3969643.1 hypothetical protein [Elizabethkingia anophelis]
MGTKIKKEVKDRELLVQPLSCVKVQPSGFLEKLFEYIKIHKNFFQKTLTQHLAPLKEDFLFFFFFGFFFAFF